MGKFSFIPVMLSAAFLLTALAGAQPLKTEEPGDPNPSLTARLTVLPLLNLYRDHLSAFSMTKCPSWPRCSHYSCQVTARHGAAMGVLMTVDRIIHEAGYIKTGKKVFIPGAGIRVYDPPESNDFWWKRREDHPLPDIPQLSAPGR